ncbi:MAG: serine hydrolase domain-containing protein [Actinomycetota bacterium]|jgi:hypothetical protein
MNGISIQADAFEMDFDVSRLGRIDRHFDKYVADEKLAGYLISVSRAGQVVYTARGGHRDREQSLPVVDDTIWRIYSMTKAVTSVAVMMLAEEGIFNLFDEAGRWIESLREPRVYVGGTAAAPQTIPATTPVRIHHLLSHTSGLTYGFNYTHPVDQIYRNKGYDLSFPKGADLASAVDDFCSSPLLFQPGEAWNYSVAVDVLGRLVEIWSGQTLDVFLRERILDPLGMTDTDWYCPEEKTDRLAQLYVPIDGRATAATKMASGATRWPSILSGGGGLVSTAHDYNQFMSMLLNGGELNGHRFLSPATIDLMMSNHLPGDGDLESCARDSFSEDWATGVGFGLGFSVITDRRRAKTLASTGTYAWGGMASTGFWVDPAEEITVGLYTQLLPSSTYALRRELQQLVYGAVTA